MQSYIPTYYRLRKREPVIALGSHQEGGWGVGGGALNFCIRGTPPRGVTESISRAIELMGEDISGS